MMIHGVEALVEYFEGIYSDEKGSDHGDVIPLGNVERNEQKRKKTYPTGDFPP
jgi:hypothetical protein